MKKLFHIYERACIGIAMAVISVMNAIPAHAQVDINSLQGQLEGVPGQVKSMINPIINIILLMLGIAVIISLVIAYIQKRKDNNSNSNDKIIDALWTALVVILGIYAVKYFFFG